LPATTSEKLTRALARIGAAGSFAATSSAPASSLRLTVRGVGRIRFPISAATARKLCAVAGPARHGFKDQTRLDTRVRDTGEIAKSRLTIDGDWQDLLVQQLERIRGELGLPSGRRLKAQLHNLLIYAPGQFFTTHRDSEKADGMIGTLVVTLPAKFTGGKMVIEHHEKKSIARGSTKDLGLTAFYADCRHEVRPVKTGYRVVLTYNLITQGNAAPDVEANQLSALLRCVREFFDTEPPQRWSNDARGGAPDRLVYLLDHEYTQRALGWGRLKGADAARAQALQEIARQLDCEIWLALADIHETWACEDGSYGGYDRRDHWDDDTEEEDAVEGKPANLELLDLIDSDVELRHWVGGEKRSAVMSGSIGDGELCYTRPNTDLKPFESAYEGYTGNAGNTVDRWYHRAAVVLWPRSRAFVMRAKGSANWAIGEVAKALESKHPAQASVLAEQLLPFWEHVARHEREPRFLDTTLSVATKLGNAQLAAALLEPFTLWAITPNRVRRLAELLNVYGVRWSQKLLQRWTAEKDITVSGVRLAWMGRTLPKFSAVLCADKSAECCVLAGRIADDLWHWFDAEIKDQLRNPGAGTVAELRNLAKPLLGLVVACQATGQPALTQEVVKRLLMPEVPVEVGLGVLQVAAAASSTPALRSTLRGVHIRCTQEMERRLQVPKRAKHDWSITTSIQCSCPLCAELTRFLRTPDRVRFEWPLAVDRRSHVHSIIDDAGLPVTHATKRTGRPYALVLEKTAELFERDARDRAQWHEQLRWLVRVAADFQARA
jgi:hypothetical protein